jgi:outer membrane protein insertion porin family
MRKRGFLSLVLLKILVLTAAGLPALAQMVFPLESLRVSGAERIPVERILAVANLKLGQMVNKADFEAARERLVATGAFENVGYQFKPSAKKSGYDAVFEVMEILQMYRYHFEDLPASDAALRAALAQQETLFGDEIPATPYVLERYQKTLEQALDGKTKVRGTLRYVQAKLETPNVQPTETEILFRPPGDVPRISEVHFLGLPESNPALTLEQLSAKFIQVAFGNEYTEAQVRLLLERVMRPFYETKGRLHVAFSKITAEASKQVDVNGVSVTVTVDEGPEFKLGMVRFDGVAPKRIKEMDSLADFKKGETVNFDEVEKGLERIRKRYRGDGYLHITARADRKINDADHTVDLTVKVDTGPVFTFGKLEIKGLDILNEPPLRKLWGPRDGKPFDPTAPEAFLKDIKEQQMFDNLGETKSETKLNEDTKTADVTLIFLPGKPAEAKRPRSQFPAR